MPVSLARARTARQRARALPGSRSLWEGRSPGESQGFRSSFRTGHLEVPLRRALGGGELRRPRPTPRRVRNRQPGPSLRRFPRRRLGGMLNQRDSTMPTHEQVTAAILQLRPNLRTVLVMAHVLGRARHEVAAALCISERCLDRRLTKALSACRARLGDRPD
jgi:hypothetical protein